MKNLLNIFFVLLYLLIFGIVVSAQNIPYQFLAKLYTEAHGRAPDQNGWTYWTGVLQNSQNLVQTMREIGIAFYTSPEYMAIPYDYEARLLSLYRGSCNREPDAYGFNSKLELLNNGTLTWTQIVTDTFESQEFTNLANQIISSENPYYYWGNAPVIDIGGGVWTQDHLETLLNNASRSPVNIPQKVIVHLVRPLVIPNGVTLQTSGTPIHNQYALMARLIRDISFSDTNRIINLSSNSVLKSIWIDGQLAQYGNYHPVRANLHTMGDNIIINNCRLSDPAGFSNLLLSGPQDGIYCNTFSTVSSNLITCYANDHYTYWEKGLPLPSKSLADGISIGTNKTYVYDNNIIDATDACIVVFKGSTTGSFHQQSKVYNNIIVNTGNSAGWGLVADPTGEVRHDPPPPHALYDFSGTEIYNNLIWTSPRAHIDVVLAVGTRSAFTDPRYPYDYADRGSGAYFHDNTSGNFLCTCNMGILINGMINANIQSNNLNVYTEALVGHKEGLLVANSDSYYASGNFGNAILEDDIDLFGWGHNGYYITGDEEVYAPRQKGGVTYYTWNTVKTHIPIPPQDPLTSFYWYYNGGYAAGYQFTYTKTFGWDPGKNPVQIKITLRDLSRPYPNKVVATKWITYYPSNYPILPKPEGKEKVITEYKLYNNYPNPFNPVTKIKFEIPGQARNDSRLVTLKVYDVLGNEVATLVNEEKPAGEYEVEFDGSALTSGIYFYQLKAGDPSTSSGQGYSETRKMVLLK